MQEEIIKECEFYLPFSEDCNEILDDNGNEIYKCSRRQDCYYKQLKQAENTVNECHKYLAELEDKIESLEQENKELKSETLQWKQIKDMANNNKYRSALEEIRELAEKYKDMEGCRIPLGAIKMTVDEVLNEKEL